MTTSNRGATGISLVDDQKLQDSRFDVDEGDLPTYTFKQGDET